MSHMWMWQNVKLEKHRGCKRSLGRNVREGQDQNVTICKTTSTRPRPRALYIPLFPLRASVSRSARGRVGDRPHSRPAPLGLRHVAPGNHRSSRSGSRHPRGARPPAPPGLPRSSPLLHFISPRQHGPHCGFPHASSPSSRIQQQRPHCEPLGYLRYPWQRTCAVSCARA